MSGMYTGAEAIYASGFTSYSVRRGVKVDRDNETVILYTRLKADCALADNWGFKSEVVATASRLLFPFDVWVLAQRLNTLHAKHALYFVNDLAEVALGRSRKMSLRSRMCLFTDASVLSDPLHLRGELQDIDQYIPMSTVDELRKTPAGVLLANLTKSPELVRDLVDSLYVMFGTGR